MGRGVVLSWRWGSRARISQGALWAGLRDTSRGSCARNAARHGGNRADLSATVGYGPLARLTARPGR